jgi:hypothetical protein
MSFSKYQKMELMKPVEIEKDIALTGTVSSRKCPTCGHHEIGITTQEGTFYPLRIGTLVQILRAHPDEARRSNEPSVPSASCNQEEKAQPEQRPWAPDPVKSERSLRLKYGVMVRAGLDSSHMDSDIFQTAYLEKLRHLIEKEVHIPIAVILDQFFTSPHLASGEPGEIALAMWQELEEIRQPVLLVKAWMEDPGEENLQNLLQPKSKENMPNNPATEAELEKELEQLSLMEFLSLL